MLTSRRYDTAHSSANAPSVTRRARGLTRWLWAAALISSCLSAPSHSAPSALSAPQATELSCGQDRRCRLERLKRRSQLKKRRRARHVDRRAKEQQQLINKRTLSALPRYRRPWGLDLLAATEGLYGGTARYSFNEHWQLGFNLGSARISDSVRDVKRTITLNLSEPALSAQVEGLYMKSAQSTSTFFGLGARYINGVGSVSDSQAQAGGGGGLAGLISDLAGVNQSQSIQSTGEVELHLISAKVGIDYQALNNGLHARLAISYHYPLFGGHRDATTGQNLDTRSSVQAWAERDLRWDIELSIGWSL